MILHLFHGRTDPAEEMDNWGFDGPRLAGVVGVHMTYLSELKVAFESVAARQAAEAVTGWQNDAAQTLIVSITDDLIPAGGAFYGDMALDAGELAA